MSNDLAHWKGSEQTAASVKQQILERFGTKEAKKYNPLKNCFTFKTGAQWATTSRKVRRH